jgi:hypothetical protein
MVSIADLDAMSREQLLALARVQAQHQQAQAGRGAAQGGHRAQA